MTSDGRYRYQSIVISDSRVSFVSINNVVLAFQ